MKIAPIDIAHKTFSKKWMGFDAEEVADFLRDIADELEAVIRERNTLKESLREKEMTVLDFRDREKVLKDTIETAHRMSEKIRVDAEREARIIINDAQQKAEMIVRDSRDSMKKLFQEITELKKKKIQFETGIRAIVQSHLSMIEQSDKIFDMPVITPPAP